MNASSILADSLKTPRDVISGFGTKARPVIMRAIGPSLPVSGALQDPTLELHDGNGNVLASNDDWQTDPNASKVQSTGRPSKDPTLELRDANGQLVAQNDNWKDSHEQAIRDTTIPPDDDHEAAIVHTLTAGNYTALVRGKNNTTGIGLVEVYNLQ